MRCSCCEKQKADIHPRKSRLMAGMTLYLCNDCLKGKMEPRFVIILTGRQKGADAVSDYIRNNRYHGAPILAKELVV